MRSAPATYQEQTHASPYWIVRWPHRRRYQLAAAEIRRSSPRTLLDYGAGDGHLLETLGRAGALPRTVAYEPVAEYTIQAQETLIRCGLSDRVRVVAEIESCYTESFDCIACLGVLEHMPLPQRLLFYDVCDRTLAPGGRCIVDVPVEIGISVAVKEAVRRTLKRRRAEYTVAGLLRQALGRSAPDRSRYDATTRDTWIQDHTHFDYRALRDEIAVRFEVERTYGSPVPMLPAPLGNQEFFVVFGARR